MYKKMCKTFSLLTFIIGLCFIQYADCRVADNSHLILPQSSRLQGSKSLFNGTIQFPKSINTLPGIRIYWKGYRLTCESDNDSKKATFIIADESPRPTFKILVTENVNVIGEYNVVQYLKVPENAEYNFYICHLEKTAVGAPDPAQKPACPQWQISTFTEKEKPLNNGIIPDDTIIICLNRDYVDIVEGGSSTLLPTVKLRSDLLKIVENEQKLHENAEMLLMSLLDIDTMHAAMTYDIKPNFQRKMIVATLTATA